MAQLSLPPVPPCVGGQLSSADLEKWLRQVRDFALAHLPPQPTVQTIITTASLTLSAGVAGTAATLKAPCDGLFTVQFSAQGQNSSTSADELAVWLRVNGADLPNSAGVATVHPKHGTINGACVFGWNFQERLNKGDTVELRWLTTAGTSSLVTYPATAQRPASPAVIFTLEQADA